MTEIPSIKKELKDRLVEYCEKYDVPIEYLIDIISDQKVLPMIRGKGVEYNLFNLLTSLLNTKEWRVEKRDINPQPNKIDEDIVVVHIKSGTEIIVECKSAVRGSFRLKTRNHDKPHFHIKCHKSRSFIGKKTNDRYFASDFDIVISNPSNAFILSGKKFEINKEPKVMEYLENYYRVKNSEEIFKASCKDWRFAITKEIANSEGVIDRTPLVLFENDEKWRNLDKIEEALVKVLELKL